MKREKCPCCKYPTLEVRGDYEICPLCDWEDDLQDDPHAEEVWGGPNGNYSLEEARRNFEAHLTMYREKWESLDTAIAEKQRALMAAYKSLDGDSKVTWKKVAPLEQELWSLKHSRSR